MKHFILFLLLLGTTLAMAQTIVIKDKTTLQPLEGVFLKGNKMNDYLQTDRKGQVDITTLAQSDSVVIKSVGYRSTIISYSDLEKNNFQIMLSEADHAFEEVIVSANKFDEKKDNIVQLVRVLDMKETTFMNQQTTADVLQQSGSVLVQKSQAGGGSIILRGFEANKVLMVIDGVRMNNAIYRGGHLQNVITIDNSMLEKTEIMFGPGSVVYGSDALGGVVHFYTKQPKLALGQQKSFVSANAFARYASANNEKTGHLDFNIGLKKFAFLTGITYSNFDDLKQGTNRPDSYGDWGKRNFYVERINGKDSAMSNSNANLQKQSGYQQYDFMQKILFQQNARISHTANIQYSTSSDINRYDRLTDMSSGAPKYAKWHYGPQQRFLASYALNYTSNTRLFDKSRLTLAYQNIGESRHDRKFNSSKLNHRYERVNVYSANLDLDKKLTKKHELRYGAEFLYNTVQSTAEQENISTGVKSPLDTRYPDNGSVMRTMAVYATHTWKISEKFILNDGIRFSSIYLNSKFSDNTFFPFPYSEVTQRSSALNASLGLVYMPGSDWRFTVLGSSGFRAPNVDDMSKVFESTAGKIVVPNSNLNPEYTYNAELGISKVIAKKVKLEAIGYYTYYVNALTSKKGTYNGADSVMYDGSMSAVYTTVNAGEAYVYGANLGLYADITTSLTFFSTLNYTYGRIKTDTTDYPLDHIAQLFGKIGFMYTMKKLKAEVFALYNGDKLAKDYNLQGEDNEGYSLDPVNGKSPAWYTLNFRLAYQVNKVAQLDFAVENIMDSYYRVFASGFSGAGRNFMVTLRGRF